MFSSKEASLKDLQKVALRGFSKSKKAIEPESVNANANAESDNKKKQPKKETQSNSNTSSLAQYLCSRSVIF